MQFITNIRENIIFPCVLAAILSHCHFNTVGAKNIRPDIDVAHEYHIIYPDNVQFRTISYWDLFTFEFNAGDNFLNIILDVLPRRYPLADFMTHSALRTTSMRTDAKILRLEYDSRVIMGSFADRVNTTIYVTQWTLNPDPLAADHYMIERSYECNYEYSAFSPFKEQMFRISVYGALKKFFNKTCQPI